MMGCNIIIVKWQYSSLCKQIRGSKEEEEEERKQENLIAYLILHFNYLVLSLYPSLSIDCIMLSMPSCKSKMRYLAWSCAASCFVFLTLTLGALGDAHLNLKVQRGRGR